jgi:hypothetical protein
VQRQRSSAHLAHRRSGRPLGGVLPIIGVIFGLGLLAGAILHPPAGTDPFASAARERGAFSWSRYRFAEFNPQATYRADVLRGIDGDTFEARIRIWSGFEITTGFGCAQSMRPSFTPAAPASISKRKPHASLCSASCLPAG